MKITLKALFTIISILILLPKAEAQQKWSAGLRTGIALRHINLTTEYDFKSYNRKWQNQVFITRTIGKRFELELNLSYSQKTSSGYQIDYAGNNIYYKDKETALNPGFTVRYYAIQFKNFSFYNQLGLEFIEPGTEYTSIRYLPNGQPQISSRKIDYAPGPSSIFVGIGSNYTLSKRFYLSGQINLKYKSGMYTIRGEDRETDWAANMLIGAGYRF